MRAAAVCICLLASLLVAATAAAGQLEPRVTPGSTYLALGDSVSFGYEEGGVVPAPDYSKASNFLGWPDHAGRALHLRVVNASCPGESSASFIDPSAQAFGCENTAGDTNVSYRKSFPLHVKYSGSQLSFALSYLRKHPKTRLVSLMIGANDLFLCQTTTTDGCASPAERHATYAKVAGNVKKILSGVRTNAGYRGQIVLMRYYSLKYGNDALAGVIRKLNTAAYDAAKPYRVRVADGYGEWRRATEHSGDDSCTAGLLTQLGEPGKCGVHPSWSGQGLLSLALIRAIRR